MFIGWRNSKTYEDKTSVLSLFSDVQKWNLKRFVMQHFILTRYTIVADFYTFVLK